MSQDVTIRTVPTEPYETALLTMSGEKTRDENRRRPTRPATVAMAPGRRARQGMRPPSRKRCAHQKKRTPIREDSPMRPHERRVPDPRTATLCASAKR